MTFLPSLKGVIGFEESFFKAHVIDIAFVYRKYTDLKHFDFSEKTGIAKVYLSSAVSVRLSVLAFPSSQCKVPIAAHNDVDSIYVNQTNFKTIIIVIVVIHDEDMWLLCVYI